MNAIITVVGQAHSQEDLIRSGTPAGGGQRILVIDIVVQVTVAAPELIHKTRADAAADGKHLGADQSLVVQIALTCLLGVNTAIENLQGLYIQRE